MKKKHCNKKINDWVYDEMYYIHFLLYSYYASKTSDVGSTHNRLMLIGIIRTVVIAFYLIN